MGRAMEEITCRAELLAVGSEILLGQIHNAHAQTISQELAKNGFFVYHHSAVGDNEERIRKAFLQAAARSNVVIVTGGLGPTVDDLTKEALASFLEVPLRLSGAALRDLERYFSMRRRPMPEENKKQAYCIENGELLSNPNGTAPGQYVFAKGVHFFLLPGPPLEMKPMLINEVIPRLQAAFSNGKVLLSRVLHFCGIGESDVDEQVRDLTAMQNPTVAPLAGEGEMLLRITATENTEESVKANIASVEQELRRRFNKYIYGVDDETLASAAGRELRLHSATVSVAESCTGGLLGSMITSVSGASDYFAGGVIAYSNDVKQSVLSVDEEILHTYGAVSEETAVAMAQGVSRLTRSTYGISVTGVAGPLGGTPEKPVGLVYVGIASQNETRAYRLQYRGSRDQIRIRTSKQALWRLIQMLQEQK
jgi:nicotinamide-nucleotide amidase